MKRTETKLAVPARLSGTPAPLLDGRKTIQRLGRILSRLNTGLTAFGGWTLMAMVALLVIDVVWRTFFTPLQAMTEFSVLAMMVVITLGLSSCEERGEHVQVEFFVEKLWGRLRRATIRLERLLSLIAALILLYAVTKSGIDAYRTQVSTVGVATMPLWPIKFIMAFGLLTLVVETIRTLTKRSDTPRSENG